MLRMFKWICKNPDDRSLDEMALSPPDLDLSKAVCPDCGAGSRLTAHSAYERDFSYKDGEVITTEKITIQRFKCSSCNKTHAALDHALHNSRHYSRNLSTLRVVQYAREYRQPWSGCQSYEMGF